MNPVHFYVLGACLGLGIVAWSNVVHGENGQRAANSGLAILLFSMAMMLCGIFLTLQSTAS